jgi:aspartyl/asparaginyl beta-hydroxylase (cupin superfamily)
MNVPDHTGGASSGFESLQAAGNRALMAGDPRGAAKIFERALIFDKTSLELWIGLAACRRAIGDNQGALTAVDRGLVIDPRCFPALLMKGSLLESEGLHRPAAVVYSNALKIAPPEDQMAEPTRRALAHARLVHERHTAELAARLRDEVGLGGGGPASSEGRRVRAFIEAMTGRRKIYVQEPLGFHYPELPAIEFHERDAFPWLGALEARTDEIRSELLAVWTEDSPELQPYVSYPDGVPLDQWAELNRSPRWSAYHLYLESQPVEAHAEACPATMAALTLVDQPQIAARSPSAMFSILRPRTRIPPHTGVANTRLVVHLPLVVPEGCGFRVGGETRQWREGEAWVFDDTIEHEAWNNSGHPRAILICDVWNPLLPPSERDMIARLMTAMDRFTGDEIQDGL